MIPIISNREFFMTHDLQEFLKYNQLLDPNHFHWILQQTIVHYISMLCVLLLLSKV
jgi:hypothetical protein